MYTIYINIILMECPYQRKHQNVDTYENLCSHGIFPYLRESTVWCIEHLPPTSPADLLSREEVLNLSYFY